MRNALMIDPRDNVAVAIEEIAAGGEAVFEVNGETRRVRAVQDIPIYHKLAVETIAKGGAARKYGEEIGVATQAIAAGAHVHTHNIESAKLVKEEAMA